MKRVYKSAAVLLLVGAMVAAALACGSCGSPRFARDVEEKLDRLLAVTMEQNGIPGAVAGVWVPGKGTWVKAAGKADVKTAEDVKDNYRFRIGSITKPFSVTVILQLVEEGKLGLENKLDKYIKGFKYGDKITIRQLCNHTSGVFAYDDAPGFLEASISEPHRNWSPDELIDLARTGEPSFPPGQGWKYSNSNTVLLGVIAEQVTGNDLATEIKSRVAQPLGLSATFLPKGSEIGKPRSQGYVQWAGRWGKPDTDALDDVTSWNTSWAWAAGAMVSSLEDLHVFAKALATGDKLLSKDMQKERLRWVKVPGAEALDCRYGLGIFAMGDLLGHDGMVWGYNSAVYYYPEEDATFAILFNRGMDQKDGQWVSPADPFAMGAASIVFPGKMIWDRKQQ